MGVYAGPDISESGLVLAVDGGNFKSFKGEPTTNLIPSPTVNAYPTTGNGWGTYNTNQYNNAQYFSIGTISNVSNNIITTSTNHPLRTYDVVRPQTTGGGVVANNDYFVKKVSDTSFTLHAYNGSQDGSQGYISSSTGTHKVYDSIATDTRISVNSTSFPTMWWGAPHLPNSGLVKELRYGEFNAIPNLPPNDCIRLHYIRTDDVKDGMSYGVDCAVTAGSPVTISFYTRAANANAVGKVIQYYIYNYGASAQSYAWNFALGATGVWERQSFTYTPAYGAMISYWFPQSGGVYAWDWSCMQVEQKSYVTSFIAGTRGATVATGGGWGDMTGNGNHGELVNGVRENSDNGGCLVFDGTDDRIISNFSISGSSMTISLWTKPDSTIQTTTLLSKWGNSTLGNFSWLLFLNWFAQGNLYFLVGNSSGNSYTAHSIAHSLSINVWTHFAVTYNSGSIAIYRNGQQITTSSSANTTLKLVSTPLGIGHDYDTGTGDNPHRHYDGSIAQVQIYNRALTAGEIAQNFNALRGRFGL